MRLLMGAMAAGNRDLTLLGDTSLSTRPMGRVAGPLRLMGCSIDLSVRDTAPVRIRGGDLRGIEYTLPVPSAQVKSAVLLAGLQAQGSTTIREPIPTRDHTERLLAFLGAPVQVPAPGTLLVESRSLFSDKVIDIPGDLSSAAFLLAAAAILPGSDLRIRNVGVNPTRSAFLRLLETFGAIVDVEPETDSGGEPRGHIRVRAGERRPLTVNAGLAAACIDEIPLVAVLGAVGDGTTVVTGAAELRLKESDRIAMICTGLQRLGVAIQPLADGFVVQGPARLSPATVHSGGDHRIAMALAVAGLTADGPVHIEGWEAVGVSYPGFEDALRSVVVP